MSTSACRTLIREPRPGFRQHYWWSCSCGDEGGPFDSYNEAWDATVDHESRAMIAPTPMLGSPITWADHNRISRDGP